MEANEKISKIVKELVEHVMDNGYDDSFSIAIGNQDDELLFITEGEDDGIPHFWNGFKIRVMPIDSLKDFYKTMENKGTVVEFASRAVADDYKHHMGDRKNESSAVVQDDPLKIWRHVSPN